MAAARPRPSRHVRADNPRGFSQRTDYDPVAVLRACLGERLRLTIPERADAIDRLDARGMTIHQIARQLGLSDRAVTRRRAARRAEAERQVAA